MPAPARCWVIAVKAEGRAEGQESEEWVRKDNGAARASNVTGGDSSKKYSRSCRQTELGPCLGENKINVQLGSRLVAAVWIVPVYVKAALPNIVKEARGEKMQ